MMHLKNRFAKLLFGSALISGIAWGIFAFFHQKYGYDLLLTLAITAGVTCYHFVMRLMVGTLISMTIGRHLNVQSGWFKPWKFETYLYQKWKVKQWKEHLPAYDPKQFDIRSNSLEQIIHNTCQAEVVHEIIIFLSFLPILCTFRWGAFPAFFITSVLSAFVDSLFVMIQRYNRPRLIRILERSGKISTCP